MTSLTDTQVVSASGGLVELGYGQTTSNTTINNATAGTGTEVIAPVTVVCDGSPILVEFFSPEARPSTTANDEMNISLFEDSSEKIRSWGRNYNGAGGFNNKPAYLSVRLTPSAGSHTYGVKAYVTDAARAGSVGGGTGTSTTSAPCFLRVSKIVQATQWPAVTTGTIICTSSTRPASPFEGQKIYETDTNRELTYDSSAWVQTNSLGGWSTWTPQLYQNGNLTSTAPHARYTRIGDTAIVQAKVSATQAGTAGYQIEVRNLPYALEAAGDYTVTGSGVYWDGSFRWLLHTETVPTPTTATAFGYDSAPTSSYAGSRFGANPSKAVASGHFISFTMTYEIA